ncbi:Exocyst complex component EXO70A1 [Linum perenne]
MRGPGSGELYLEAIEQLKTTVKFFNSNKNFKSSDGVVYHANQLLAKSISKLEEELKTLLYNYRLLSLPIFTLFQPSSASEKHQSEGGGGKHSSEQQKSLETAIYTLPTLIPLRVVLVLHDLALQMVQVGRQRQLLRIFRIWTCQCQSILSINARDTRATVLEQILRKLGVEKLTKVDVQRLQWEVLEAKIGNWIHFMQISFEIVFGSKAYMEMKESVFNLAIQLAQTAQETFIDFEEALERDATKSVVLDGSVHPLTSYVINYVKFLFDYQSTVKELFQELELDDPQGQLADVTTRIMQALQNNLDGKSKIYRDPALTQLFLMNNIHYIVRSVYGRPMHKFVREGFTVRVCVVRGELDNGKDTLNVHMGKGVHRLIRVTFPNARSYGGKQAAPSKEWKQVSQPSVDTNGTEVAAESSKPPAGEDDSPVPDINSSAGRGDGSVPKASSEAEGAPSQVAAPETSPEVEGSACHSPISGVSGSVIHACSG